MDSGRRTARATGCLKLTRAHKILALVPQKNACSDDDSTSEDETDIHPPSPSYESSDPPSINSSLENLNISNSDSDSIILPVHLVEDEGPTRFTPTLQEVFPSPSTSNYNAIPTLDSIQSIATPTSSHDQSPAPSLTPHVTRSKRKKTFSTPLPTKRVKKEKFKLSYKWSNAALKHRAFLEEGYHKLNKTDNETILDYFHRFFSQDILADIVLHTNLYSVQQKGKSIQLTEKELKTFLAIQIYMGLIRAASYTDYWATRSRVSQIADLMSLKRYQEIRRFLHFSDNSEESSDRYCKIRPVMEKIRQNCLKLEEEGEYSIDEMMIPYKGRKAGKRKQYVKNKPKKWGFKNFVRAGVSGIIYDFLIYGGEDTFLGYSFRRKEVSLGLGALVVIALCKSIQKRPSTVYADNFFMCPELVYWLREEYGIFCLGTIRNCRLRGCQELLPTDKMMKKKPRGYSAQVVCNKNKLAVVKWHDNKVVTMISSFVDSHPMEKIKRYSKTDKKRVEVDCPQVVKLYNKHMGGVDLADMLISLYRTPFKTRRWYMGIFSQLIDICINNAWLLYRRDRQKKKSLKDFRFDLFEGLCKAGRTVEMRKEESVEDRKKIKKPVACRPVDMVRYDNIGHFPDSDKKTSRCRYCKDGRTLVFCIKCNVKLCFVVGEAKKRNCFLAFHTQNK